MSETHDELTIDQLRARVRELEQQNEQLQRTNDALDREHAAANDRINEMAHLAAHHERYIRELGRRIEARDWAAPKPAPRPRPPARRRAR